MDARDLIDSFGRGFTVTRRAKSTIVRGVATPAGASTFPITAAKYPASGRDLMRLPEGRRSIETSVLVSTTPLLTGAQGAPNEADQVAIGAALWEVQHVEPWEQNGEITDVPAYRIIIQAPG